MMTRKTRKEKEARLERNLFMLLLPILLMLLFGAWGISYYHIQTSNSARTTKVESAVPAKKYSTIMYSYRNGNFYDVSKSDANAFATALKKRSKGMYCVATSSREEYNVILKTLSDNGDKFKILEGVGMSEDLRSSIEQLIGEKQIWTVTFQRKSTKHEKQRALFGLA